MSIRLLWQSSNILTHLFVWPIVAFARKIDNDDDDDNDDDYDGDDDKLL